MRGGRNRKFDCISENLFLTCSVITTLQLNGVHTPPVLDQSVATYAQGFHEVSGNLCFVA